MRRNEFFKTASEARAFARTLSHKPNIYHYDRKSERYFYMIELCNHLNRYPLNNWEAKIAQAINYFPVCVAWNGREKV